MHKKSFRDLRRDINEKSQPKKVELAGDEEGGDVNRSRIDLSLKKQIDHTVHFIKHPAALDHQFSGSIEAVGIDEDVQPITEDIIPSLEKIVSSKTMGNVKFDNKKSLKVDLFTASALIKVHKALNNKNKANFAKNLSKSENTFMKMVDFAFSKVG